MTAILDIPALSPGDEVHHALQVKDIVVKDGEHARTVLTLGNRTGSIASSPFWAGRDAETRGLAKGMLVQAVGKVTTYRETTQLEVVSLRHLPKGSVPLADLVPSVGPVEEFWETIDGALAKLTAPRLRAVLELFYRDPGFRERYEQCPGAPGFGHHAALGGLLQHTCEVLKIGWQIARIMHADHELVAAGALLHDIGKLESYSWNDGVFETTERGRLVGHVVQGVIMLRDALACAAPTPCTPDEHLILEHLILSHHGKLEFGSPVLPLTLEAQILHFADDASAKTAAISDAFKSREFFPGESRVSARKVWAADNRWLFRATMDFGREPEKR